MPGIRVGGSEVGGGAIDVGSNRGVDVRITRGVWVSNPNPAGVDVIGGSVGATDVSVGVEVGARTSGSSIRTTRCSLAIVTVSVGSSSNARSGATIPSESDRSASTSSLPREGITVQARNAIAAKAKATPMIIGVNDIRPRLRDRVGTNQQAPFTGRADQFASMLESRLPLESVTRHARHSVRIACTDSILGRGARSGANQPILASHECGKDYSCHTLIPSPTMEKHHEEDHLDESPALRCHRQDRPHPAAGCCDAGLPIPPNVQRIDLAVSPGVPGVIDVIYGNCERNAGRSNCSCGRIACPRSNTGRRGSANCSRVPHSLLFRTLSSSACRKQRSRSCERPNARHMQTLC